MWQTEQKLPLKKIQGMRFSLLALLLLSIAAKAQKSEIVTIETFPVNATVITTLEGLNDRAVLRIDKVEPNPYNIEVGDTLLFSFYWTILPVKSELANFPGIGNGDEISVHISVKASSLNGSYQYTAYHYKNRTRARIAKSE